MRQQQYRDDRNATEDGCFPVLVYTSEQLRGLSALLAELFALR